MSNTEHELLDYLKKSLIASRHQLAAQKRQTKIALAIVAAAGISFLASMGACIWSVNGIYRENSRVIEQAVIMQNIHSAMRISTPQDTRIEISLPSLPLLQEVHD